jgi:VIT1/CCC1 family predicted Fe2+/Mn2+ transporter
MPTPSSTSILRTSPILGRRRPRRPPRSSLALLPLLAILFPPVTWRVPVTFVAVLAALGLAGALSARIGGSNVRRAVLRVVIGGAAGLAFTYGVGHLFGTALS